MEFLGALASLLSVGSSVAAQVDEKCRQNAGRGASYRTGPDRPGHRKLESWGPAAMNAIGRNPEARGAIQTNMILAIAFAEALGIYALVAAIMIGFVF